jgi:hypothetical protein
MHKVEDITCKSLHMSLHDKGCCCCQIGDCCRSVGQQLLRAVCTTLTAFTQLLTHTAICTVLYPPGTACAQVSCH